MTAQRAALRISMLAALGACTSGGAIDDIDYRVTGGLDGDGDGTALHVARDGAFTRQTRRGVTDRGTLDPATFGELLDKVRAAEFPELGPSYPCGACGDDYIHDLTVQIDGTAHQVMASAQATLPDRLAAVVEALRTIIEPPVP
ncbi:MAG TPA: hypothetical protein VGD37_14745 [Kofleriaceae bacterium]|jgi:hypothetical protein